MIPTQMLTYELNNYYYLSMLWTNRFILIASILSYEVLIMTSISCEQS